MIVLALVLCGCNTMLWFLSCTAWKVTTPLGFIKECPAMICRYLYFFSSSLTPLSTSGNQPHPLYFNLGVSHTYEASPEISRTAPIWRGPGVSRVSSSLLMIKILPLPPTYTCRNFSSIKQTTSSVLQRYLIGSSSSSVDPSFFQPLHHALTIQPEPPARSHSSLSHQVYEFLHDDSDNEPIEFRPIEHSAGN